LCERRNSRPECRSPPEDIGQYTGTPRSVARLAQREQRTELVTNYYVNQWKRDFVWCAASADVSRKRQSFIWTRPLWQGSVKLDKRAAAFITSVYHGCATLRLSCIAERRSVHLRDCTGRSTGCRPPFAYLLHVFLSSNGTV